MIVIERALHQATTDPSFVTFDVQRQRIGTERAQLLQRDLDFWTFRAATTTRAPAWAAPCHGPTDAAIPPVGRRRPVD